MYATGTEPRHLFCTTWYLKICMIIVTMLVYSILYCYPGKILLASSVASMHFLPLLQTTTPNTNMLTINIEPCKCYVP